ncbi:hypothetical protein [Parasegetibacter sp. NRK P23]|uniref:hypothetical protein n=1 Tax=Parasegetibacter sp. NRK P23 TaxID=2942999 RepID=UPI0020442A82|nr:hypothetical protein [Parasegetibacter sp. NRK P23]MCM5528945.1 hypothetical protein [Parasegetibacter sp. NRK P23]
MDKITQNELLKREILKIRTDVTSNDKKAACKELGFSKATVSLYLGRAKGTPDVRDNDTAASLIVFFKKCIQRRNQVINK